MKNQIAASKPGMLANRHFIYKGRQAKSGKFYAIFFDFDAI